MFLVLCWIALSLADEIKVDLENSLEYDKPWEAIKLSKGVLLQEVTTKSSLSQGLTLAHALK